MSFLPVTSVGQAVQAGLLLRGAATVVGSGFRQMLASATQAMSAAEPRGSAADVLPMPPSRPTGAAERGRVWGRIRELAGELRDRLLSLGVHLPDAVQIDADGGLQVEGASGEEVRRALTDEPGLKSLVERIAEQLRALTPRGDATRLTFTPDTVDVRAVGQ